MSAAPVRAEPRVYRPRWFDPAVDLFFRWAASGLVPARWFLPAVPGELERKAAAGPLRLEIVSHCWNYARMALYQLSSLALYPPQKISVLFTFFYSEEDAETKALVDYFQKQRIPNVAWNWCPIPKEQLFRREIGRNRAALSTAADWVWFTDCDILFHRGCLDGLADALQGRRDVLLFPRHERSTDLLDEGDPILRNMEGGVRLLDIESGRFTLHEKDRAKGEYQIVHGDVARACGYCNRIWSYQTPSARWCKCRGDRAFRWLVRTQGRAIEVPGVFQIRHKTKGRYGNDGVFARIRGRIRQFQDRCREKRAGRRRAPMLS